MILSSAHGSKIYIGWGNGTTTATLFARQGATLFGCDISLTAAEKAASQIRAEPPFHNVSVVHGRCHFFLVCTLSRRRLHSQAWPHRHPSQQWYVLLLI